MIIGDIEMLGKEALDLLALVRESIHKDYVGDSYDFSNTDWQTICKLAQDTKLLPIIVKRMKSIPEAKQALGTKLDAYSNMGISLAIRELGKKHMLNMLIAEAKNCNVPVLLFKGVIISQLYPEPSLRISSDTDMYIDEEERDRMTEILMEKGYEFHEEDSNENVVKYLHPSGHYIELHSKLWSFIKGTKIDELQKMGLTNCRVHGIFDGVECDTIAYGEQLIFLMFHLYKHLMFEHANLRFLTDILLFLYKYAEEMDLNILKDRLVFLGYWKCFCNMYGIGLKYLGFDKLEKFESLGIEEYDSDAADAFIEELLLYNLDEEDEEFRFELTYSMTPYLTGDDKTDMGKGASGSMLSYLFPSYKNFPEEYAYVKKCALLLPMGWAHRIIKYVWETKIADKHRMAGTTRLRKVDEKVNRLKSMQIIE